MRFHVLFPLLVACLSAPAQEPVVASWYGSAHHGRTQANGRPFDRYAFTAAHRTLPLGTRIRVSRGPVAVVLTVEDRGPWVQGRELDVSEVAAKILGFTEQGTASVRMEVIR